MQFQAIYRAMSERNPFRSISVKCVFYVFRLERAERRGVKRVDVDCRCQRRRGCDARNADVATQEEAESREGSAPTVAVARVRLHRPPVRALRSCLTLEISIDPQYILKNSIVFSGTSSKSQSFARMWVARAPGCDSLLKRKFCRHTFANYSRTSIC